LYLDAERDSGYIRDQNVFGDDISSEDTMSVLVRYGSGVVMNYSLIAYAPWEGFRVSVTGDKGRIELDVVHGTQNMADQGEQNAAPCNGNREVLRVMPIFEKPYEIPIPKAEGGHGGGDPILLEHLFLPEPPNDPFGRAAGFEDGLNSIMVGIAANQSMASGLPVDCGSLFPAEPVEAVVAK
jgi:hypothetical protein